MENIFIINTGGLKETVDSLQHLFEQNGDVFATGLGFDGPVVGKVYDVDVTEVTPYDDVNQESFDKHEIVQVRVDDFVDDEDISNEQWVDTTYHPDEIDQVRYDFPDHEYRVVLVTDEIYTEFDDVVGVYEEQDEIDSLKARVIELEAELSNFGQASTHDDSKVHTVIYSPKGITYGVGDPQATVASFRAE